MNRILSTAILTAVSVCAFGADHLTSATAIKEVFGDGAKVTSIELVYDGLCYHVGISVRVGRKNVVIGGEI